MRVLVVTNLPGPFVRKQMQGLRRLGVDVAELYLDRANVGRSVYLGVRRRVSKAVQQTRPDVVHVMYGGVMAAIVTRVLREPPVVVTFYGSDLLGGREPRSALRRVAVRYGTRASRRAARRAAAIVVQSHALAEALPGRERVRAVVVPDGIDLELFTPLDRLECQRELGWDPARKHVLFPSSRQRPEKRYALAEAAVARVDSRHRAVLHELSGVPHARVPIWLNAADAIVLTSTHEGSPNVVKEALACDVAVVSVDVGDVAERLDGIDGCFLAEPTADDIAARLDEALSRETRIAGRATVTELSLDRVARRLLEVYCSTVAGP